MRLAAAAPPPNACLHTLRARRPCPPAPLPPGEGGAAAGSQHGAAAAHAAPHPYAEALSDGLNISTAQADAALAAWPSLAHQDPAHACACVHALSKLLNCTHRRALAVLLKVGARGCLPSAHAVRARHDTACYT